MTAIRFAALLDAIPEVPTTAFRDTFYAATTTAQTRVHNLETGNIERWTGAAWVTDFVGLNGPVAGGALLTGSAAPAGTIVGSPGWLYLQQVSATVSLLWTKQSGVATTSGWAALEAVGTGSPQGVLAAPVGTPYTQQDGATGLTLWFKQSGTGTTGWALVQESLGWFNVRRYGATGDGVTDDTTAIQAAITACQAATSTNGAGGVVYFPPGTYQLSSGLTVTASGVHLWGAGHRNTVLNWAGGAAAMLTLGTPSQAILYWSLKRLRFRDSGHTATHGVYLGYAREGTMEDCYFISGMTTAAVYLFGTTSLGNYSNKFIRVTITSTSGDGWYLGGNTNACFFHGCLTSAVGGTSVRLVDGFSSTFSQCQFTLAGSGIEVGIYGDLSGGRILGYTFSDCYFELKSGTAGARACLVNNSGGNSLTVDYLLFTGGGFSGQGAANYLFESNCTSGAIHATVLGAGLCDVLTAAVKATTTADHWTVIGTRPLNGFGIGSAVPLLDNTSGAASNATSQLWGDGGWTLTGVQTATRFSGGGTAHVAGDYALSAGWGTTATVSAVSARDTGGRVTISSAGTGQTANPTVTLTWKNGTWTTLPAVVSSRGEHVSPTTATWEDTTPGATTMVWTFLGTPVAGSAYILDFVAVGK